MKKPSSIWGFSLVEVTIALGVIAFCLVALLGLLPTGLKTHRNGINSESAANILAAVVADMRATPRTSNTTSQFGIQFGSNQTLYFDEGGTYSNGLTNTSVYRLTITFRPAATPHTTTLAHLSVTNPAAADPTAVQTTAFETLAAFDRQ